MIMDRVFSVHIYTSTEAAFLGITVCQKNGLDSLALVGLVGDSYSIC